MKSVIEEMHERALHHSRRAARLLKESIELNRSLPKAGLRPEVIARAVELNRKAIEESKRSLHTMDFLLKYREAADQCAETRTSQV